MDNKGNKRGFSGLSGLSTDIERNFLSVEKQPTKRHPIKERAGSRPIIETESDFQALSSIAKRVLELEKLADDARRIKDINSAKAIYSEIVNDLMPRAENLTKISQNKAFSFFVFGLVLRVSGMNKEAVTNFQASLEYAPNVINTLLEITKSLGELDRKEEALTYAKRAVSVDPESPAAWGNLAMSNIQLGNRNEAYSSLKKAIILDPDDPINNYIKKNFDRYFDNQKETTKLQTPDESNNSFPLIELTKWPTLPAPWSSTDRGETYVWGDFFLTFQKRPKTVLDLTKEMQGQKAPKSGIIYHYAITVFYRLNKNPHGPSHRPIMVVALEQANIATLEKMLGVDVGDLSQITGKGEMGSLMIGLFSGETRINLGEYKAGVDPESIRKHFFEIIGNRLDLPGHPKIIGDLSQAHGNPETGLPAKKKNSGCLSVILFCIGLGGLGVWGMTFI